VCGVKVSNRRGLEGTSVVLVVRTTKTVVMVLLYAVIIGRTLMCCAHISPLRCRIIVVRIIVVCMSIPLLMSAVAVINIVAMVPAAINIIPPCMMVILLKAIVVVLLKAVVVIVLMKTVITW